MVRQSDLAERMGMNIDPNAQPLDFPSGSMFWFEPRPCVHCSILE